jgi:hypothetical protein
MQPRLAVWILLGALTPAIGCGRRPAPPAGEPTDLTARVVEIAVSRESAMYLRARVVFSNATGTPCKIRGYTLAWVTATKTITLDDPLLVPPGETRERWARVMPDDGELAALTPAAARVAVQAECGKR